MFIHLLIQFPYIRNSFFGREFPYMGKVYFVIKEGLQWILNRRPDITASSLLGIPPTLYRLYSLALKFRIHTSKMNPNNPLMYALFPTNHHQKKSLSKKSFAYKVVCSESIFSYSNKYGLPPPEKKFNKETHEEIPSTPLDDLEKRIKIMISNKFREGIMGKCILPSARVNAEGISDNYITSTDRCVFIKDNTLRKRAIAWRLNSVGINHKKNRCPVCKEPFNRRHIKFCDIASIPTFEKILNTKDLQQYRFDLQRNELPDNYNILDSLLNHKRYKTFSRFMQELYTYWELNK
ncbi:hypothetical protein BCR32DRAFT_287496 [Anaeromyces robustus]|uniref:Uncharacterized protein n=1 Tax=Anaeromyces robustus TaxID=1754192 RepID=A0A1Y1VRE2_9FUNG|nr:hypothetical protein BCR32DRAFT_287496 [Anaeromyces robustus]|eukprot:ORX63850.1 hypothetical protein BCR32DRAFT_287496 [Anaeromyces robustus]